MSKRFYKKDIWWVSPFNDVPEVLKATRVSPQAQVQDLTLGDWGKSYGAAFSAVEARQVAEHLREAGVTRLDIGLPAEDALTRAEIRDITAIEGLQTYIPVKAEKALVDVAAACGATGVVVSAALGYPKLRYQLGRTWQQSAEKSIETVNYAKEKGLEVILAPGDAARANPQEFEGYLKEMAKKAMPAALRIEDPTGGALPQAMGFLVTRAKKLMKNIPVQVHAANGFGLALASTLAGLYAGADVACASVMGLGKRSGNAALEEVISCLKVLLEAGEAYYPEHLFALSLLLEQLTGIEIPALKPIGGLRNYMVKKEQFESATHHPLYTFGTSPQMFGRTVQRSQVSAGKTR